MTADQLREIIERKPFRPLAVTSVAGQIYRLEEERDCFTSPRRPELFVFFTSDGSMHTVEAAEVASITVL
jgi:hypothetical protein